MPRIALPLSLLFLLSISLLCLVAGSAGATDLQLTTCSAGGGGVDHSSGKPIVHKGKLITCTTETIPLEPDPCVAVMREAMKAMDGFLGTKFGSLMEPHNHAPYLKALKQWDEAKGCWKEQ